MAAMNYRIHPAIGIARVGNSEEFYLGPETIAGSGPAGGLPIKAGTEDVPIKSSDLRDESGRFKRQAARFKIYQYPEQSAPETYPLGLSDSAVQEIKLGSRVGDKLVTNILWTVHMANKKANTFVLVEDVDPQIGAYEGICGYSGSDLPPLRNWEGALPGDKIAALNEAAWVKALTIDPGPRTISGADAGAVAFDQATPASYSDSEGKVTTLADYPKSFPADSFSTPADPATPGLDCPASPIDTLGELQTDSEGRLLVLGGYGRACGWNLQSETPVPNLPNGEPTPFTEDVNNDQWFDDASDGPVSAVICFDDGSVQQVQGGAWVVTTDPSYAPQTLNTVSLFDDIYDSWVRKLNLAPKIHSGVDELTCTNGVEQLPADWFTQFDNSYKPSFEEELNPIFQSIALQRWNINLNNNPGVSAHEAIGNITADTDPNATPIQNLAFIRVPGGSQAWRFARARRRGGTLRSAAGGREHPARGPGPAAKARYLGRVPGRGTRILPRKPLHVGKQRAGLQRLPVQSPGLRLASGSQALRLFPGAPCGGVRRPAEHRHALRGVRRKRRRRLARPTPPRRRKRGTSPGALCRGRDGNALGFRAARGRQEAVFRPLVCVYGFFELPASAHFPRLTTLEAVENGWWYAARLPDGRLAAAAASDADWIRRERLREPESWLAHLATTRQLSAGLAGCRFLADSLLVSPAPYFQLDRAVGPRWLAVGDAACAFDPTSGQGIHKALATSLEAAESIAAFLAGDRTRLSAYGSAVSARFEGYLQVRDYFYGLERRWSSSPFWRRRRERAAP